MSNSQRFSGDLGKNANLSSSTGENDAETVPRQLKEVAELMSSINRRLEDCAVEWQSSISQQQWRIIDSKPASEKLWEHSLLARTYFIEPSLDETFQSLLVQGKSFTEQINHFIALLRGEEPSAITATVRDAQNQFPDRHKSIDDCQEQSSYPAVVAPLDLSSLEIQSPVRKTRKSKRLAAGIASINIVQRSFADLMKAKINLDTKFLGFEAVLNGSHSVSATNPNSCLCQICSNVLGSALDKGNAIKGIVAVRQKGQRITKVKNKRLKTSRAWNRRGKTKNQTVSLAQIGDQATRIASVRSYKSIAE